MKLPQFATGDLVVFYRTSHVDVQVNIKNISDATYYFAGRNGVGAPGDPLSAFGTGDCPLLVRTIHEDAEREAGRDPSSGAGECSSSVAHSPESLPFGLRTGFGGPTPPEHSPPPTPPAPIARAAFVNSPGRTAAC